MSIFRVVAGGCIPRPDEELSIAADDGVGLTIGRSIISLEGSGKMERVRLIAVEIAFGCLVATGFAVSGERSGRPIRADELAISRLVR
jgi:hypothetical protein